MNQSILIKNQKLIFPSRILEAVAVCSFIS